MCDRELARCLTSRQGDFEHYLFIVLDLFGCQIDSYHVMVLPHLDYPLVVSSSAHCQQFLKMACAMHMSTATFFTRTDQAAKETSSRQDWITTTHRSKSCHYVRIVGAGAQVPSRILHSCVAIAATNPVSEIQEPAQGLQSCRENSACAT